MIESYEDLFVGRVFAWCPSLLPSLNQFVSYDLIICHYYPKKDCILKDDCRHQYCPSHHMIYMFTTEVAAARSFFWAIRKDAYQRFLIGKAKANLLFSI